MGSDRERVPDVPSVVRPTLTCSAQSVAIFDLDLDDSTEAELWNAFESWGKNFKCKLREQGPSRQIRSLNSCLAILADGNKEMNCCEWLYYLQKRDSLFIIESIVSDVSWEPFSNDVRNIDDDLRAFWIEGPSSFPNPREPEESYCWWYGLPAGVLP